MKNTDTLAEALREAAQSLETIARNAGKALDTDGQENYLRHFDQVRGYANSRATVARAALEAQAEAKPAEDFCFCGDEISLQGASGGAAPEGLYGRVRVKVGGQYVDYVRAEAKPAEPVEKWRDLAIKFDRQRMAALAHLRTLLVHGDVHAEAVRKFLSEPPSAAPAAPADLYERLAEAHDASLDDDHRACRVILTECMSRLAAPAAPAPVPQPSPHCLWPSRGSCRAWQDKQAEAKPLTPEQIDAIAGPGPDYFDRTAFARAIEQAHGIGAASKGGGNG